MASSSICTTKSVANYKPAMSILSVVDPELRRRLSSPRRNLPLRHAPSPLDATLRFPSPSLVLPCALLRLHAPRNPTFSTAADWTLLPPADEITGDPPTGPDLQTDNPSGELRARFPNVARIPTIGARPSNLTPSSYNELMKSFSRSGKVNQVLQLLQEMKNSRFCPNVLCYNTVINALVMAGRFEEAEAVFEELILSGLAPNIASYNILVKLHSCFSNRFDLAYEVIRRMMKCGYRPDATTYSTLISGLCRAGRIEEAWDVLDWMLEEKCPPTVHTYTPIVQEYCSKGRVEEAQKLMATMESIGCPPNSVTYNLLIKALCNNGSFDEVERLIRESSLKSWKPNAVTYNTYMNGLCKMGRAKEAFEQLEVMLGNGLYPTAITLNIILDCLCHDSNIWEARFLLERSYEFGWDVGVVGYNTLMSRLYETGGWLMVLMLFTHMLKKGVSPNTRTFNILIQSLCKGGKLRIAKSVLHGRGFLSNVVTYNILLHWFYEQGNINEVRLLYSSMVVEKIAPDTITYTIMIKGLCREGKFTGATDCFIRSLEGRLDQDMFVVLIHRLVKGRRLKEMLYLFEGMARQGCVTDGFIFDSVIRSFCKSGFCQSEEIYNVCLILDKMLRTR